MVAESVRVKVPSVGFLQVKVDTLAVIIIVLPMKEPLTDRKQGFEL